jgi:hypothetical protein
LENCGSPQFFSLTFPQFKQEIKATQGTMEFYFGDSKKEREKAGVTFLGQRNNST